MSMIMPLRSTIIQVYFCLYHRAAIICSNSQIDNDHADHILASRLKHSASHIDTALESGHGNMSDGYLSSEDTSVSSDGESEDLDRTDGFHSWNLITDEFVNAGRDLSAEELLGEDFEREASNIGEFDTFIYRGFFSLPS